MSDKEIETFGEMHQCLRLSDGSCQKCRMVARIKLERRRAELAEGAVVAIGEELQALRSLRRRIEEKLGFLESVYSKNALS